MAPPNPFLGSLAATLRGDIAVSSQDCGEYPKNPPLQMRTAYASDYCPTTIINNQILIKPISNQLQIKGAISKYGAYTGDMFAGMLKDVGCEVRMSMTSRQSILEHR